ncbi:MAG: zinc ribbon domain-containing protein [Acidobacteriota bacterium]
MPIYEYTCQKCGHHLEVMQKMSDKPLTKCPKCKGKLDKIFSQTSFQLKGSGWYVTDYTARGKADKADKVEKTEKADTADKADKVEKADTADKSDKSEKVEKVEKVEKPDKADKAGKSGKKDKSATI